MQKISYCKACRSILTMGVCTNKHCPAADRPDSKWIIDGVLYRFSRDLTKAEAEEAVRKADETLIRPWPVKPKGE